ncbi:MAG TPA: helix-turn-helix transcriptional regulator [Kofleriaceae bacterium]|jgi:DNA-binding XRE family transcriptional regulator|nr:helix-turn-helix transcriptional regulator [Kofleriaceae bacterium]
MTERAIRHYRRDLRTTEEKQADEDARLRFERGEFLAVDSSIEKQALEYVQLRYEARRDMVATLGKEIGVLRHGDGLTQDQLARAVGTAKSNISRLESGRYGGRTVERFIAVLDAFDALGRGRRSA